MELRPTFDYDSISRKLTAAPDNRRLFCAIVDTPFEYKVESALLYLGIVVLLLVNARTGMIDRVALSNTELAQGAVDISVKRFEDIKIPVTFTRNIIAKAIHTGKPQRTTDWRYLFEPALTPQEARFNQAGGAIACSAVYPLVSTLDGGALIFSYYQYPDKLGSAQREFMQTYTAIVAAALRNRV